MYVLPSIFASAWELFLQHREDKTCAQIMAHLNSEWHKIKTIGYLPKRKGVRKAVTEILLANPLDVQTKIGSRRWLEKVEKVDFQW